MTKFTKQIAFGQYPLVLETGEIARQADAAVLARGARVAADLQ